MGVFNTLDLLGESAFKVPRLQSSWLCFGTFSMSKAIVQEPDWVLVVTGCMRMPTAQDTKAEVLE